jgi:hypothetical protein
MRDFAGVGWQRVCIPTNQYAYRGIKLFLGKLVAFGRFLLEPYF